MRADPRIQADAVDDGLRVEPLHLGIGVQVVEITDAQRQVGIGEKLDCLRLGTPHEKDGDVLLDGTAGDERSECACGFLQRRLVIPDDDAARIKVVVESLALPEEFRGEEDLRNDHPHLSVRKALAVAEFLTGRSRIPHRNRGFDDHDGVRVHLQDTFDHFFDMRGVEEVLLGVVVGRGGDHDEIGPAICAARVQGRRQVQFFFGKVAFDLGILDRTHTPVDFFHFLRNHVDGHDFIVLRKQRRDAHAHISGSCNSDSHILQCKSKDFFTSS